VSVITSSLAHLQCSSQAVLISTACAVSIELDASVILHLYIAIRLQGICRLIKVLMHTQCTHSSHPSEQHNTRTLRNTFEIV
jgi:hypothetical protein